MNSSLSFGDQVVIEARRWIGTPFRWEQSLRGVGADCRGLLSGVARALERPEGAAFEANVRCYAHGIDGSALLAGLNRLFDRVSEDPLPGDILAFRIRSKVQHLAISTSDGRMIHALSSGTPQVVEVPLCNFWRPRVAGVWRWRHVD